MLLAFITDNDCLSQLWGNMGDIVTDQSQRQKSNYETMNKAWYRVMSETVYPIYNNGLPYFFHSSGFIVHVSTRQNLAH